MPSLGPTAAKPVRDRFCRSRQGLCGSGTETLGCSAPLQSRTTHYNTEDMRLYFQTGSSRRYNVAHSTCIRICSSILFSLAHYTDHSSKQAYFQNAATNGGRRCIRRGARRACRMSFQRSSVQRVGSSWVFQCSQRYSTAFSSGAYADRNSMVRRPPCAATNSRTARLRCCGKPPQTATCRCVSTVIAHTA